MDAAAGRHGAVVRLHQRQGAAAVHAHARAVDRVAEQQRRDPGFVRGQAAHEAPPQVRPGSRLGLGLGLRRPSAPMPTWPGR